MIDGLEENIKQKKKSPNSTFVNISSSCTPTKRDLRGNTITEKLYLTIYPDANTTQAGVIAGIITVCKNYCCLVRVVWFLEITYK